MSRRNPFEPIHIPVPRLPSTVDPKAVLADAEATLRSAERDIHGPEDGERLWILMGALDSAVRSAHEFEKQADDLRSKANRNRGFADFYRHKALDFKKQADDLRARAEALELFKMVLGWMVDYEPEMVHRYVMGHHALDPFDLPAFFRAFPATDTDGWLARNGEAMDRAIAAARGGKA